MDGGIISGCQTDRYGGGIQVNGGTFNMSGGTISNCYAVNARANNNAYCGGGVAVLNGAVFTMEAGSLITGNHGRWGGGVGVTGGATFIMNGGTIKDNTAEGKRSDWGGGGVHVNNAVFLLKNGEISGNTTTTEKSQEIQQQKLKPMEEVYVLLPVHSDIFLALSAVILLKVGDRMYLSMPMSSMPRQKTALPKPLPLI